MGRRLQLHQLLKTFTPNVYFQPPTNKALVYPCIIYHRDMVDIKHADNRPYTNKKRYMVMIIDTNPDSPIPDMVASLPLTTFNRFYTADNLNHDVYNVYY